MNASNWPSRESNWNQKKVEGVRMPASPMVVGLGEILWDLLPSGPQLGGAPANFAYCSHLLGNRGMIASRIGEDDLGRRIRRMLQNANLSDRFIQTDYSHSTGTVKVHFGAAGQPQYEITKPVAWDFLEWTREWQDLANCADAICFGSLAQRADTSRCTILKFVESSRPECLRVFDVNLRQKFYSAGVLSDSLLRSNAMKLNHEEVPIVAELLAIQCQTAREFCEAVTYRFGLKFVCVTRGEHGSLLYDGSNADEHPGFRVAVKDTVGAGDAFTAGLVHGFLRKEPLSKVNDASNRLGAWVSSNSGAMPEMPREGIESALRKVG
jgi:fructokinase